jgi:predicted dinucleotide-binding enzyme
MTDRVTIFGYGPVGRGTAARLADEGREVIIAQRNAPSDLPKGAAFKPADACRRGAGDPEKSNRCACLIRGGT